MSTGPTIYEASDMVMALRAIREPTVLVEAVQDIVSIVGGEIFVFYTCANKKTYRYLIGCPPALCQKYNARTWREIDPLLLYAEHHIKPALGSSFKALSDGQRELMECARQAGFASSIGIPVRLAGEARLGVLYVGSPQPDRERMLYAGQGLLIHLANELLDWVNTRVIEEELGDRKIALDTLDRKILRFSYQGFTAEQIADLCEVPVTRVRQRMRRHNEKFKARNHKGAVARAIEMGLLRLHECSDNNASSQLLFR